MGYTRNTKQALREIYSQKVYVGLTVLFGVFVFIFNALITNYKILLSSFSFKLFFSLLGGVTVSMSRTALLFLIVMSVLAGVVLSMSVYLIRRQVTGSAGAGSSSVLASFIAPSCPSCAVGLLSMLGLGGFLGALPFKGLELGVIGIVILIVSLIFLSGKIVVSSCTIKEKTLKNRLALRQKEGD